MTLLDDSRTDATAELVAGAPTRARTTRWHPVLVATVLAGLLHLLWWRLLATPGGDMAAQDAWAAFAKAHPGSAYDLAWYGGMHPVSYSAVSPYLMAFLGVRPTMVVAGTLTAALLALLLDRTRWVARPLLPAVVGAVALTGNAVSGRVTFGLGLLFGVAALVVAYCWPLADTGRPRLPQARLVLIVLLTALATATSAVAGLFLGLGAAALWLTGDRRLAYAMGLPPVAVVAVSAWLFPLSGVQPMAWYSAILPTAAAVSILLFVPREWRVLRVLGVVYLIAVQLAWLVPSPVGTNIARLGLIFGGVALAATLPARDWSRSFAFRRFGRRAALGLLGAAIITSTGWQVGLAAGAAIITSTGWQVGLAARDAISTSPPPSWNVELEPLVAQLEARGAESGRVEVVPTASHREATALAPYVNLARGWNRQADAARNHIFYRDRPLTARAYQRWLHRWAVHYVVLSTAAPDAAAGQEAALVAGGLPYLERVWSDDQWALYEVAHPTPLAAPPAEVLDFDAAQVTVFTPGPGPVVIRIAYSRWLGLVDALGKPLPAPPQGDTTVQSCLSGLAGDRGVDDARDNWLVLHATHGGVFRIGAPYTMPRGSACPS